MNPLESLATDGRIDWPRVVLVAIVLATLGGLTVAASTSTEAFGPYNPAWDGASDFHAALDDDPEVEVTLLRETTAYSDLDANETVAFVIAPDESYDEVAAADVAAFVERGGTVVVLENFEPHGNDLLEAVGAEARLDGQIIRDEEHYFRGPAMPVATGVANHSLTDGVEQLTLNYATAVEPGNATVLVTTSDYAYRAEGPDDELTDEHNLEVLPVATVESVGEGTVIVVGDPSITTNAMRAQPDNAAFLSTLAHEGTHTVVDVSHTEGVPPLAVATLIVRDTPFLQGLIAFLGIGALAVGSRRRLRPSRLLAWLPVDRPRRTARAVERSHPGLSDAERAAALRRRYPEWDDERIERVIEAFNEADSRRSEHDRD
ncbi:DUF4350 domain-containing protein [Natrialbaceae archaeon A-CW1-1]